MNYKVILPAALVLLMIFAGCKKETQPAEENDNELITTVQLDFTQRGSGLQSTFLWEDGDGPGGELPVIDSILLEENKVYDVRISFFNKSVTPAEDITEEVKAESESHRVYYEPTAPSGITINGYDNDTGGLPLGINSVWTTTTSAVGNIVVVLRHYPNGGKEADDAINDSKATTDAGAIFNVRVGD